MCVCVCVCMCVLFFVVTCMKIAYNHAPETNHFSRVHSVLLFCSYTIFGTCNVM